MKYTNSVEQLEFFDLKTLKELTSLQNRSVYKLVKRSVEDNSFIRLKKGLYTTNSFVKSNNTLLYKEKNANILKTPSKEGQLNIPLHDLLRKFILLIIWIEDKKILQSDNKYSIVYNIL